MRFEKAQKAAKAFRQGILRVGLLLVLVGLGNNSLGAAPYEALTDKSLDSLLNKHCSLVIPWASWCSLCIEELPLLLPALGKQKEIHPVVIDFSRPYVQENFSKTFLSKLGLEFATYRVALEADEKRLRKKIDPDWDGALPRAMLFTCTGKKCLLKRRWVGKMSVESLADVKKECSTP